MKRGNFIFTIFIFLLLIFAILVFTEIIELNFLGFSKNTKKNIRERAFKEENPRKDSFNDKNIELEDGMLLEIPINENEEKDK
jgi:hypothetical protein